MKEVNKIPDEAKYEWESEIKRLRKMIGFPPRTGMGLGK